MRANLETRFEKTNQRNRGLHGTCWLSIAVATESGPVGIIVCSVRTYADAVLFFYGDATRLGRV